MDLLRTTLPALAWMLLAAHAPPAADTTRWHVIVDADGAIVGTISEFGSPGERETVTVQSFTLQEPGGAPTAVEERTVTRHGPDGRVLTIDKERRAGRTLTRTQARILATHAEISRKSSSAPRETRRVPLPPGTRLDGGRALLAGWDIRTTPRLAFSNLNLEAMEVEQVVLESAIPPRGSRPGHTGVIRRHSAGDVLRGIQLLVLDPNRRVVETRTPMFGTAVAIRPATAAEAAGPRRPFAPLARALVRAPFRMGERALAGRIRYRLNFRDGLSSTLPQTGEQRVTVDPAGGVTLDICRDCGPGLALSPAAMAAALEPTTWLQSDHPRIRALASPPGKGEGAEARRMEALVRVAEERIQAIDFAGHHTALDTLARRRGDCTESAVLLAALGRAAGIRTKVASGLVYSRERYHGTAHVFLPHSWVLAHVDGRWRSYDAALGGFDASHIALSVSDGDARSIAAATQLGGLISWREMQEVRPRPAQ